MESRVQGIIDAARGPIKCRIPQRLTGRQRTPVTKPKIPNTAEATKSKMDETTVPSSRYGAKTTCRMRYDESVRPKSANRVKDDMGSRCSMGVQPTPRSARIDRNTIAPKRHLGKPFHIPKIVAGLPDQETIEKHEALELQQTEYSNQTQKCVELNEQESITSWSDKVMQLRIVWQEKLVQFENMKTELVERQRVMMELYATMQITHKKMWTLGQKTELPPADDLRIMNVAKLTPVQLLQLCAKSRCIEEKVQDTQGSSNIPMALDVNKIHTLPAKLVGTCEQTLCKMKEIIDWFESIRKVDKCISMQNLAKKLGEFLKENEILNCSLEKVKNECYEELNDIVDIIRKGVNETMALQLRMEQLTLELSELNSQNANLRKQMHNTDHLKSQHNKYRYEDIEKELNEEKSKKSLLRDRLLKADRQVKIAAVRISQLEATVEQNNSQNRTLERTIQQLHEQNHKLQVDFDKELNKLVESIKENTAQLEEIADSRQKLQFEKEELEKRLDDLSEQYNESLKNLKHEMDLNVNKVIDSDKKYHEVIEDKKNLEEKVGSLCAQLIESELRCKDLRKQLQDSELELNKSTDCQLELESNKRDLDIAKMEIEDYRNRLMEQNQAIRQIEHSFKETLELEETYKRDLINKDKYIMELENKLCLLEQQLQERESKITSYEKQLLPIKHHISKLQEDFGDFENLNQLHQMQREKILEATQQNAELAKTLQNKDIELERYLENLVEKEQLLDQKSGTIKMLSEKEEEQANIIKLLRNNLEKKAQADTDLNQQLCDKNTEISTLLTTLEKRKQQISEFEKIIQTLEDQTSKANFQISQLEKIILSLEDESQKNCSEKIIFQEKIIMLENKVREYETCENDKKRAMNVPTDNLDNLIKILENELGMPLEPKINAKEQSYLTKRKYFANHNKPNKLECHDGQSSLYQSPEPEKMPTKIVMGNFVKETYMSNNEERMNCNNHDHKKAISNMNAQEWIDLNPEDCINVYDSATVNKGHSPYRVVVDPPKENYLARNLHFYDQLRDDKKMFKFAGHRL